MIQKRKNDQFNPLKILENTLFMRVEEKKRGEKEKKVEKFYKTYTKLE